MRDQTQKFYNQKNTILIIMIICIVTCYLQLRGARTSTCYGSGVEEGMYHYVNIVYW